MQATETFRAQHCVLGVDPGLDGGYAVTRGNMYLEGAKMPTYNRVIDRSLRRFIQKEILARHLAELQRKYDLRYAAIENVHSSKQMGVVSAFTFGIGFGIVQGILATLGVNIVQVEPSVWKPKLGLTPDKKLSLAKFQIIFGRKCLHHGTAEAALIAYFQQRKLMNDALSEVLK